jgi:hypothetical protein
MSTRRWFAPVVVTAAVAGGGVAGALTGVPGIAGAQEAPSQEAPAQEAPERDGPLRAAADALGTSARELAADLHGGRTIAEVAEGKGVDVKTVIDAMVAAAVEHGHDEATARERITRFVEEGWRDDAHHRHPRVRRALGVELDAAADALGLERGALIAELREGRTIADLAEEQGVDVDTVIDAMVAPVRERITTFVHDGAGPAQ